MSKIQKHALTQYTEKAFPSLFYDFGQEGLDAFTEHDKKAAQAVSELKECDQVVYVGYSKESAYPDKIVSFVDCKNGMRFYVTNGNVELRAKT